MTSDAMLIIQSLFSNTIRLMDGITVPGTNWTYLTLFLMTISITVVIGFTKSFFGMPTIDRITRNSSKIKISKERKGDTK